MRWVVIQVLIIVSSACAPSPTLHMTFSLPAPLAAADCVSSEAAPPNLKAALRVGGGYPDCPMVVSTTDSTVSGTCEDIQVGIVRPLMMVYTSEPDASKSAHLAFHVGFIDLRPDNIDAGTTSVQLTLDDDDTKSEIAYYSAQILDMPGKDDDVSSLLDEGRQWARAEIEDLERSGDPDSLDSDMDGCPNLVEACNDELFMTLGMDCTSEYPPFI